MAREDLAEPKAHSFCTDLKRLRSFQTSASCKD